MAQSAGDRLCVCVCVCVCVTRRQTDRHRHRHGHRHRQKQRKFRRSHVDVSQHTTAPYVPGADKLATCA